MKETRHVVLINFLGWQSQLVQYVVNEEVVCRTAPLVFSLDDSLFLNQFTYLRPTLWLSPSGSRSDEVLLWCRVAGHGVGLRRHLLLSVMTLVLLVLAVLLLSFGCDLHGAVFSFSIHQHDGFAQA